MRSTASRDTHHRTPRTPAAAAALTLLIAAAAPPSLAQHDHTLLPGLDAMHAVFGPGTGVIVGVIDNGVDTSHPALRGIDSHGRPRVVAERNFAPDRRASADDTTGHGTAVAGLLLGADRLRPGPAHDARFVNARVSDANLDSTTTSVVAGLDFAYASGASVLNVSLNENAGGSSDGDTRLSRAADYFVAPLGVSVVVSAGNFGHADDPRPTSPADAYNVITVGATAGPGDDRPWEQSAHGPTADGRAKPDVVAPGAQLPAAARTWTAGQAYAPRNGTSFAAPLVSGVVAAQVAFGEAQQLDTDPLVIKATLLNSADKAIAGGSVWTPGRTRSVRGVLEVLRPLDPRLGAGRVDAEALVTQYAAGEAEPGVVPATAWDRHAIAAGGTRRYRITDVPGDADALTVTLTWSRHVGRYNHRGGDGTAHAADDFIVDRPLADLDLEVLRDGAVIARSISKRDNVEHLYVRNLEPGVYTLRVTRNGDAGLPGDEPYALAWRVTTDAPARVPASPRWPLVITAAAAASMLVRSGG